MKALVFTEELETGVRVKCWVVEEARIRRTGEASITLRGYLDQAAYEAGKAPVTHKNVNATLTLADIEGLEGTLLVGTVVEGSSIVDVVAPESN